MSFFEHGVHLQRNSRTVGQARVRYAVSCDQCCSRGFRMDCDRCPIANAHKESVEVLRSLAVAVRLPGRVGAQ